MNEKPKFDLVSSVQIAELEGLFLFDRIGSAEEIKGVSGLANYDEGFMTFCLASFPVVNPGIIICDKPVLAELEAQGNANLLTFLVCESPKLLFSQIVSYMENEIGFLNYAFDSRISSSAIIHDSAVVSQQGCIIEENVVIQENVVIRRGVSIGANSLIQPNCVLGETGYGFTRYGEDKSMRFPHLAGLSIGNNVEIGSLVCIDRGPLSDTVIEDNVKINNFSMIGHGVNVKRAAYIHAGCTLSGGSVIGELCWIGPNSSVNNKVSIGRNCLIGTGSVVNKDLPANGVYVGTPAKYIRDNS